MTEVEKKYEEEGARRQKVVVLMGSVRDRGHAQKITEVLEEFGVAFEMRVGSAHKTPKQVMEMMEEYLNQGEQELVVITVAGLANALSGMVKGLLFEAEPPIAVIAAPPFNELDIWSSLRLPYGVVVPVMIDPRNAALLAVEVLSRSNPTLAEKYVAFLRQLQIEIYQADEKGVVE